MEEGLDKALGKAYWPVTLILFAIAFAALADVLHAGKAQKQNGN